MGEYQSKKIEEMEGLALAFMWVFFFFLVKVLKILLSFCYRVCKTVNTSLCFSPLQL